MKKQASRQKNGAKRLWYFRTPGGCYFLATYKPGKGNFAILDSGYGYGGEIVLGSRKPRGFPPLAPGECVPVELAVVKKKKARKG